MKKWIIAGIVIASLIILNNTCITGNCVQESEYDDFAKYLTSEGISLAGTDWCSHCFVCSINGGSSNYFEQSIFR